ncbi:hypothetical protein K8O61_17490 [Xanthomonas cerealis pv. cerealis]|nr:hypothetical protein [Xanthomonas translucens]UKE69209.1 hypothetical protein K8O61_17490 [Xanthomonas translucens pv. pistacia]
MIAADCIRIFADQIRALVPTHYTVLGTYGFGRSDTRTNLRRFFEVDRYYIAHAAIAALAKEGKMTGKDVARAIKQYKIDPEKESGWGLNSLEKAAIGRFFWLTLRTAKSIAQAVASRVGSASNCENFQARRLLPSSPPFAQ